MQALLAAEAELQKERADLVSRIAKWNAEIARQKHVVTQLEGTLAQLQAGGDVEGLPRCEAEILSQAIGKGSSPACDDESNKPQEMSEEELMRRMAECISDLGKQSSSLSWGRDCFQRQFLDDPLDSNMAQFLMKLSLEQRLVWEIQNPVELSPRVDRRLIEDLRKAGKSTEVEVLRAAAGPPTETETEYRALLWLHHHPELNASYSEPGASGQSLLTLACGSGFCNIARALLARRAEVNHHSKLGLSALASACKRGSLDCVRLLLEEAADPNEGTAAGRCLESGDNCQITQLLIKYNADPNCLPNCGGYA
eukprot:TRINITY_DN108875_c0_g1_i1.p1 TRINITY_DN108875_c0_g1~~TRINITY_DN108875_c0_g1_i1.p1  ORF type:complete len:311 (-),score=66.79 TRINITY_DN108875_c0_g1_i1:18-950(-)